MATSCISTTTSEAQADMYPWRRGPYVFAESVNEADLKASNNEASVTKPLNKKLSAEAAEFVPQWARNENTVATLYDVGNCFQISLDAYSDNEDEGSLAPPSPAEKPSAVAIVTKEEFTPAERKVTDEPFNVPSVVPASRPWRVPMSNVLPTTASCSSHTSSIGTAKSKRPWKSGSIGQQKLSHTAPAAQLPPWKRAALKPVVGDGDDEVCNDIRSPSTNDDVITRHGKTDSGASTSTPDSDAITSEDSGEEESIDATQLPLEEETTKKEDGFAQTGKPPAMNEHEEADRLTQSLSSSHDATGSCVTMDIGASMSTIDSDASASEDARDDESIDDTPSPPAQETTRKDDPAVQAGKPPMMNKDDDVHSETQSLAASLGSIASDSVTDNDASTGMLDYDIVVSEISAERNSSDETSNSLDTESKDLVAHECYMSSKVGEHDIEEIQEKHITQESSEENDESMCETEPEAEEDIAISPTSICHAEKVVSEIAIISVFEVMKWRAAVGNDEVNAHEVPGRLVAWAETAAKPSRPCASSPITPLPSKTKRSLMTTPAAPSSPTSGSWRRESVQHEEVIKDPEIQNEAALGAHKKKLQVSENSWVAKMRARRNQQADCSDAKTDEEVIRSMKGILNKLTLEKFPQLYQQMISCGIRTSDHLEQLIQEVFEKATTQHHFIDMYADLCAQLHAHFAKNPITEGPKMSFKNILLNACQASFEKNLSPPADIASMSPDERTAAEFDYKMRMIGNIRLVGALLVRKMLASKVMLAIIEELLSKPTPEALETLAALLTVVGAEFDTQTFTHRVALNAIFCQVQTLAKKGGTPARVRCLLKDVLDLRAAGWLDKKPRKIEKPTTLDEVHQKAATEYGSPVVPTSKASHDQWSTILQKSEVKSTALEHVCNKGSPQKGDSSVSKKSRALPVDVISKERSTEKTFDRDACHKEIVQALTELFTSYDIEEAVTCVVDTGVPGSQQANELCDILAFTFEEGSAEKRRIGFKFVAKLFLGGCWKQAALADGLRRFIQDTCVELKYDVPALPQIMCEEFYPALVPVVEAGLLQASQHQLLTTSTF